MTQPIRSMFTQGILLPTATTWTLTDSVGAGRTVTFNPSGANWYRHVLAPSAPTGTELLPYNLVAHIKTQMNAAFGGPTPWHVTLDMNGYFEFSYTGTGTAAVTAIDSAVAPCMGITAPFGGLTNGGSAFVPPYHPTHVVYATGRTDDTDWIPRIDTILGCENEDGTVDVVRSGITGADRQFTFFAHPRDWATKIARSAPSTPFFSPEAQWRSTHLDTATLAPPWSIQRFMHSCAGRRLGVCLDFQSQMSGGSPTIYECTIGLESLRQKDPAKPTRPYYEQLLDWRNVRLRFLGVVT